MDTIYDPKRVEEIYVHTEGVICQSNVDGSNSIDDWNNKNTAQFPVELSRKYLIKLFIC